MLAEMVKSGKLPPLDQRLPKEPVVIKPKNAVGKYGGTLRQAALGPTQGLDIHHARRSFLLKVASDWKTVVPNIAKGWDFSPDNKIVTLFLREGLKWSDGAPFTAEDIAFWFEDIILNDELTPVKPKHWSTKG